MKIVLGCVAAAVIGIAIYGWSGFKRGWNGGADAAWSEAEEEESVRVGLEFNADSAYAFTKTQCDFGPRPMNTDAHSTCAEWIIKKFE